jgi:hypothetical protein
MGARRNCNANLHVAQKIEWIQIDEVRVYLAGMGDEKE